MQRILLLLPLFAELMTQCLARSFNCDLQLRYHPVFNGVGVFAGRNYTKGEIVDRCISFELPAEVNSKSILRNYCSNGQTRGVAQFVTSFAMLYNHAPWGQNNVVPVGNSNKTWLGKFPRVGSFQSPLATDHAYVATKNITAGQQILNYYGTGDWFLARNIEFQDPFRMEVQAIIEEMKRESFVQETTRHDYDYSVAGVVDPSSTQSIVVTPEALHIPGCAGQMSEVMGGRVYAKQMLFKGETIEVTRAFLAPPSFVKNETLSKLPWFEEKFDIPILLSGTGLIYAAGDQNDLESSNIGYSWYTPDNSTFFWDDMLQTQLGFVRFYARGNIVPGTELLVPLTVDEKTGKKRVLSSMLPTKSSSRKQQQQQQQQQEEWS